MKKQTMIILAVCVTFAVGVPLSNAAIHEFSDDCKGFDLVIASTSQLTDATVTVSDTREQHFRIITTSDIPVLTTDRGSKCQFQVPDTIHHDCTMKFECSVNDMDYPPITIDHHGRIGYDDDYYTPPVMAGWEVFVHCKPLRR